MSSISHPPTALIVGGSLGGLFTANLLHRRGWNVEVFEQSGEELAGRGAGIVTHGELFHALQLIGIPVDDSFGVVIPQRVTFDRSGAVVGKYALRQILTNWARLYALLKAAFPPEHYHFGLTFEHCSQNGNSVAAGFANGSSARGDLLVGADGIRSSVRAQLFPETRPTYAGYVGWRGLVDEKALSTRTRHDLIPRLAFCLPTREQMLGYPVAGHTNSTRPGERCYNFVWYRPVNESADLPRLCTDINGRQHDMSIPPPLIRSEVLTNLRRSADELLSPQFSEVVHRTPLPFFQAIFDLESPRMASGRVALLGDAAFVARPHCGMGVTKAAGDALSLVDALQHADNDIPAALTLYEESRLAFGTRVVKRAGELGAHLQGCETSEARRHHTPEAVMREIAIIGEFS